MHREGMPSPVLLVRVKRMKAFTNRYELKYILDWPTYYKIRKEIEPLFKQDPAGGRTGKYGVISVYYDTPDLKFFWEKMDGEEQRIKVRLRKYAHESQGTENKNNVFLEIKKKKDRNVMKKRVLLKEQTTALFLKNLSIEKSFIKNLDNQWIETLNEVLCLQSLLRLQPTLVISYIREPFVSKDNFPVRITFDSNVRYRHKNLSLTTCAMDKHVLSPNQVIMEIKFTDYFPQFMVQIIQRNMCEARTFSKYGIGMEHFLGEQQMLLETMG